MGASAALRASSTGRKYSSLMIRMLVQALVLLISAALGLLVAKAVVDGMTITWGSFVVVVLVFTVLQAVLAPFLTKVTDRNAPALLGGVGLITTFVSLLITSLVSDGLTIDGASAWLFASLVVWIVTMLGALIVPFVLVKAGLSQAAERRQG
jgi:hypothetical protein